MKTPHIRTPLPGPKAEAMLKRSVAAESPSYPRDYPFVMSHGRGAEVWDVDGNRFLDFMAGIAVCSKGHAHPQVVQALGGLALTIALDLRPRGSLEAQEASSAAFHAPASSRGQHQRSLHPPGCKLYKDST